MKLSDVETGLLRLVLFGDLTGYAVLQYPPGRPLSYNQMARIDVESRACMKCYEGQPAIMVDYFGNTDPKRMPAYFFSGAISIDYKSAIRANTAVQNCGVAPRHWYVDARFQCRDCKSEFTWTAHEQKNWFERDRFHIDSKPKHCRNCRAKRRASLRLRKEYDALVAAAPTSGNWEQKERIVRIIDELEALWGRVPRGLRETREVFRRQLERRNEANP